MLAQWFHRTLGRYGVNRRDVALMITSLLLAFTIWFLYNMRLNYSDYLKVQVVAQSNIPGHFDRSASPVEVEARCRATGFTMLRLSRKSRKPVTVALDPAQLHLVSEDVFSISSNEMSAYVEDIFGPDVVLESFLSPSFSFKFPVENHKTVPVIPIRMIDFKNQYTAAGEMNVKPDSVIVYGESAYIDNIDGVMTRRISLSNVSSNVKGNVKLDVPRNVRLSAESVSYDMEVVRYVEVERTVVVSIHNLPSGKQLSVYPSEAEVVMKCRFPVVNKHVEDIEYYIDYNDFVTSVDGRCVARTDDLPSGIISCSITPEIFECVENVR